MIAQNLILKCDRCTIPDTNKLVEFVTEKLQQPTVDYSGPEIDPKLDFHDEEITNEQEHSTYISIHFSHPVELDSADAIKLIQEAIAKNMIQSVKGDEKDVELLII